MALHSGLTGSDLHENKGVASASNNTVATASGGATVWQKVNSSMVDTTSIFGTNKFHMNLVVPSAAAAADYYIALPFACTISDAYATISGGITTTAYTVTITTSGGGAITILTFTVPGVANTTQSATGLTTAFAAGSTIRVQTNATTGAVTVPITLVFTRTA